MHHWDIVQSKHIYRIKQWGEGFFGINQKGELTVSSDLKQYDPLSLYSIARELKKYDVSFPVLLRFPDILQQRIQRLCNAFATAMRKANYCADYTPVYPIKVNQQCGVVKTVLDSGQAGLEAGSKAEMMAILALSPPEGTIITCNGYKDRDYIRLALIALELGLQPYIIIEKKTELKLIAQEAAKFNITPLLGVRVKLASVGYGKWQDSGGEKSKFGLNSSQLLDVIHHAEQAGLLHSLQLMHFHVGSQIPNIHDIQKILSEAGRYYSELRSLDVPIRIVNSGGGLGVDYEGTMSARTFSKNYTVEEYANNIIYEFKEICRSQNLPEPDIITETGRALTAHHAVLITDIIDAAPSAVSFDSASVPPVSDNDPDIIRDLSDQLNTVNSSSALEVYHNAVSCLNEAHIMFSYGVIDLKQRAHAEQLVYTIFSRVREVVEKELRSSVYDQTLDDLNSKLADKYFANFSLFASAPDAWALEQLFPVVPLHRLDEYPTRRATLHDLTCDSDGQFKKYVHSFGPDTSLPVHPLSDSEPYLIGVFLIGAYQEILGDMHNLFGTPYSVNVHFTEQGKYTFSGLRKGDSVRDMLGFVHFETENLPEVLKRKMTCSEIDRKKSCSYIKNIEDILENYSYLRR
ncbi:MAG: biosynthetic arginine decarboxylase [Candidatus Electrothrix sp. AU1_5]|nr:biosynthetic arginine decarboxylase [Candidatus Electrothrix gigas]